MPRSSTMLTWLDRETADFHAGIDAHWLDLLSETVSRDQYKSHLARTMGFEAPVESALAYTPKLIVANRRERSRSGLIAQDLLALGVTPASVTALPQCQNVAPFRDPPEALGWKYVVERPTQLHAAIKRNVLANIANTEHACSYLSACDGVAAARWHQLGMLLDDVSARRGVAESIIMAARAGFACLTAWYARDAA